MDKLANDLMQKGHLQTDLLIDAFAHIPRLEFIPAKLRGLCKADVWVPLGSGQIMPAPSVIAAMLELLKLRSGQVVLVAGFGTGWVSALISYAIGSSGHVISCDKSITMEKIARTNVDNFSFIKEGNMIEFFTVDTCRELEDKWKFDRIVVMNPTFSQCQLQQYLKVGGIMVAPQENIIYSYYRKNIEDIEVKKHEEITFLPK